MSTRNRPVATDREREGVRAREIARQASRGVGWGGVGRYKEQDICFARSSEEGEGGRRGRGERGEGAGAG